MIKNWRKEIKCIGFIDWFWFVILKQRNEFHKSFTMSFSDFQMPDKKVYRAIKKLERARSRAHRIDEMLSDLRKGE
jgi:hypothetical protein